MKNLPETHQYGRMTLENANSPIGIARFLAEGHYEGDLGLQVAADGRIWLCINGVAFMRFSPHPDGLMKPPG